MKKNKLIFTIILPATLVFITFFYLYKNFNKINNHKPDIKIIQKAASLADIKIENFSLKKLFSQKTTQLKIIAKTGQIYREKDLAECTDTKIIFSHQNKNLAILKAQKAVFNIKNSYLELSGGVNSVLLNNSASNNSIN